jgi:DNA-binding PucR family transcriptional regulator
MNLQVRVFELVQMSQLGLRLLTGEDHLDREIRWVHVTDLPDPQPYLRGGELILTNGLWRTHPSDAETFVTRLVTCDVAALGLAVYRPDETPDDLIEACRRHKLVLFEVPDRPFMDISEAVIGRIMHEREAGATHLARVEQSAVWRLGRGEGPQGILRALHHAQGVDCWLLDRTARIIAAVGEAPGPEAVTSVWRQAMLGLSADEDAAADIGVTVLRLRATPEHPDQVDGVLAYANPRPRSLERADLDLAGDLLGQELAHRAAVRDAERRFAGELVALAAQDALSSAEVSARLNALQLDPERELIVAAIGTDERDPDELVASADGLEAMLRLQGLSPVIVAVGDGIVRGIATLAPGADDSLIDGNALATLATLAGSDVAVGVAHGPARELRRLLTEASHAAAVAALRPESPAMARSQDTSSHLLLLALHSDEVRVAFTEGVLGPVRRYDAERSGELLHSLETFLESGCSWQVSAAKLHVHVNTLRYRIARVEQLTGRDLATTSDRVDLYLAIQAQRPPHRGL